MPAFLAAVVGSSLFKSVAISFGLTIGSRLFFNRRESEEITGRDEVGRTRITSGDGPGQWVLGRSLVQGVVADAFVKGNLLHLPIALSEGNCEVIESIIINGEEIPLRRVSGTYELVPVTPEQNKRFRLFDYLDDNDPDKGKTLRQVAAEWTDKHVGRGISWVHLQLDGAFFEELPEVSFIMCGIQIRWPGNNRRLWTDSAAALRWWWETERKKTDPRNINRDSVIRAHEQCSETISYELPYPLNVHYSGYSTRYGINGVLKSTDNVRNVEAEMDFCWFGTTGNHNGVISFDPGIEKDVEWTVGRDDIIRMESMITGVSDRDRLSAMQVGVQALREKRYRPASLEVIDQDAFDSIGLRTKDSGARQFVTDGMQLARIADLTLRDELNFRRWTYILKAGENLENLRIRAGSVGILHDPRAGLHGQKVRVQEMAVSTDFTVRLTIKEELDWSTRFVSPPAIEDPVSKDSSQLPRSEPPDIGDDIFDPDVGDFAI